MFIQKVQFHIQTGIVLGQVRNLDLSSPESFSSFLFLAVTLRRRYSLSETLCYFVRLLFLLFVPLRRSKRRFPHQLTLNRLSPSKF